MFAKRSPNQPKIRDLDINLKSDSNNFFGFWPDISTKHDLQFQKNLFFRKICNLEIFDLEIFKKNFQIDVFDHFIGFGSLVFLDFAHSDRRPWCLVVLIEFASPVNLFLFIIYFWLITNLFSIYCWFSYQNFNGLLFPKLS